VEIEAYAIANLVDKMESGGMVPAPLWTNVKTFPAKIFRGCVDILTAGYPCQPFSAAGKRGGKDDPRHLWPFIREHVKTIKPTICFFENVEGHISLGLSTVISDLEEDGYTATWGIFSAAEVGAPHQRKRVYILAHSKQSKLRKRLANSADSYGSIEQVGRKGQISTTGGCEENMADTNSEGLQRLQRCGGGNTEGREKQDGSITKRGGLWPARPGQDQYEWEEPRVIQTFTRIANRHGSKLDEAKRTSVADTEGNGG
jgi:site-specific DNA-cytosine methylase